jgi:ATP synthase protein I
MSQDNGRWIRKAGLASSIGLVMVISIAIGYFFGSWLDRVFRTSPWLMLVFTIMGIVAGFVQMIRIANELSRDE